VGHDPEVLLEAPASFALRCWLTQPLAKGERESRGVLLGWEFLPTLTILRSVTDPALGDAGPRRPG
jgi:hypothetical protein